MDTVALVAGVQFDSNVMHFVLNEYIIQGASKAWCKAIVCVRCIYFVVSSSWGFNVLDTHDSKSASLVGKTS